MTYDIEEVIKWGPELKCKNRFAIINDRVWETVILYYHVNNYFSESWNINSDFVWFVIYNFCEIVDNDKN